MRISDWSSDVCSSDLISKPTVQAVVEDPRIGARVEQRLDRIDAVEDIGDVALRRIGNRARLLGVIALVIGGDGDEAVGQAEIVELIDGRQPGAERLRHARSDEHTSALPSLMRHSYAVFSLTHTHSNT